MYERIHFTFKILRHAPVTGAPTHSLRSLLSPPISARLSESETGAESDNVVESENGESSTSPPLSPSLWTWSSRSRPDAAPSLPGSQRAGSTEATQRGIAREE